MVASFVSLTAGLALVGAASAAIQRRDCTYKITALSGDTCASMASDWGLSESDFEAYNPQVGSGCSKGLVPGQEYCIQWEGALPGQTTTLITTTKPATTSKAPTTTSSAPGNAAPSPVQSGIDSSCTKYYKAVTGDSCSSISEKAGTFSIADFEKWNPAVGSDCTGLWANYYYCVAVPGTPSGPTTTKAPTTTTSAGSSGPSPTQSGIISSCTKYYKAVTGDSCSSISEKAGTFSVADFEKWNPAVGSDCTGLWAGYYYCVAAPGGSAPPTSTSPQGPQPEQTGIASNCKNYYKVQSGDYCDKITQQFGITNQQFYTWNPAVGTDCKSLWVNYYVCVGV